MKKALARAPRAASRLRARRPSASRAAELAADPGLLICQHDHRTHYLGAGGEGGEGGIFVCFACWLSMLFRGRPYG